MRNDLKSSIKERIFCTKDNDVSCYEIRKEEGLGYYTGLNAADVAF
jgi:hypothetical protein